MASVVYCLKNTSWSVVHGLHLDLVSIRAQGTPRSAGSIRRSTISTTPSLHTSSRDISCTTSNGRLLRPLFSSTPAMKATSRLTAPSRLVYVFLSFTHASCSALCELLRADVGKRSKFWSSSYLGRTQVRRPPVAGPQPVLARSETCCLLCRYYGRSIPPVLTQKHPLRFLTHEQALADYGKGTCYHPLVSTCPPTQNSPHDLHPQHPQQNPEPTTTNHKPQITNHKPRTATHNRQPTAHSPHLM